MRKLIFAINITIDGCCDHTKGMADEEVHQYFASLMKTAGTIVYGRKTYELMNPFWPDLAKDNSGISDTTHNFALAFDAVPELIVFSHTLDHVPHTKTRIVNTDLKEAIIELKQGDGKDILLGGVDLPSQLMEMGLIDEYILVVQPLIVGAGRRLFDTVNPVESLQLKLASTKVFKSGGIVLHYVK